VFERWRLGEVSGMVSVGRRDVELPVVAAAAREDERVVREVDAPGEV
jgi:hypothetical protein